MTRKQPASRPFRPMPPAVVQILREATAAHQIGNLGEAETLYRRVLKLDAKQPQVLLMLGILHAQRGNYVDAEQVLQRALKLNPDEAGIQFNYGNVLLGLERFDDALAAFGKAAQLNPTLVEAHLNRGNILMLLKRYEEAVTCFDSAIRNNPAFAQAYGSRAHALEQLGRLDEALASCNRAVDLNPGNAEFRASEANILSRLKRHDDALRSISAALSLRRDSAAFHYNHGNILIEGNNYRDAIAAFEKSVMLDPSFASAHLNEGLCRLLLGDTERGWEKYESRLRLPEYLDLKRDFAKPVWSGDSSLEGKTILIHAEQGFGDTLMACRYVPLVAALGARVVLEVKPELVRLMEGLDGVFALIARGQAVPQFDIHCPIMSLPRAFKTRLETIPGTVPYLRIPKENIDHWRWKLGDSRFKVGIAWAGNPSFKNDRDRSITLRNILPVCSIPGAAFFSIQKDLRAGDAEILSANPHIAHLGTELNNFLETAAVMQSLDLIVSSDTSIVNLAGALGRPVWVLLSVNPDWRWLLDRTDSPWYPTARLFRQNKGGDWDSVVAEVRAEMKKAPTM
jgi:tetratricopeptide (TPR) repeat protein